jgi:hypothetical protein
MSCPVGNGTKKAVDIHATAFERGIYYISSYSLSPPDGRATRYEVGIGFLSRLFEPMSATGRQ